MKFINIVDLMYDNNNLGKNINFHNFSKIKKVFEFMANDISKIDSNKMKMEPYNYLNSLLKIFNKSVTFHNSDLFLLSLPQPKILIIPSNLNNLINQTDSKKKEQSTDQTTLNFGQSYTTGNTGNQIGGGLGGGYSNNSTEIKDIYSNLRFMGNSASVNNDLINLFNKKFSLINTSKDSSININTTISKTAKNFVWPSR